MNNKKIILLLSIACIPFSMFAMEKYVGQPFEGVKKFEKPETGMGCFVRQKPRKTDLGAKPSRKPKALKKHKKVTWNDVFRSPIMQKVRREKIKKLFKEKIKRARQHKIEKLQNMITQNWNHLKAIWHHALTEEQRTVLEKKLSRKQKEEIIETTMKKHINEIRSALISEKKDITQGQWEQAIKAAKIVPNHDTFMTKALKRDRKDIINYAKRIDKIKDKIYSKNKKIKQQAWEKAQEAAKTISDYRPKITQILANKKKLEDIIKAAKKIDTFIEEHFSKGDTNISMDEAIPLFYTFDKLPGYKDYIPNFLKSRLGIK